MPPERRALLIGIDKYKYINGLSGAANDAQKLAEVLAYHEDGQPNYACIVMTNEGNDGETALTQQEVRKQLRRLFDYGEDVLFYFAGHGVPSDIGGFFCTYDSDTNNDGLAMDELLKYANASKAKEVLLILDCCHSGGLGDAGLGAPLTQLREGVTILTASRSTEKATEVAGKGIFTELMIGALMGGAADIRGEVSAAAVYAYIEQALGPWDQRPMYKSHASKLSPVRRCTPKVPPATLKALPKLFAAADAEHKLEPSYEYTHETARPEHVEIYKQFKALRDAGLLRTKSGDDLYFTALRGETVILTSLGQHYWRLVKQHFI